MELLPVREYPTKTFEYRLYETPDGQGAYYDVMRAIEEAGGVLKLYPAISPGLKLIRGLAWDGPKGPTYHRFHPARDFAGDGLRHDLEALKYVTRLQLEGETRPGRIINVVPGPKVGQEMAEQMFQMANEVMGEQNGRCTFIKPLGPADWLEPLRDKFIEAGTDLTNYGYGYMDEFRLRPGVTVPATHPLSFRGKIEREFVTPLVQHCGLKHENVKIPDTEDTADYDDWLEERGLDCCFGGIGWGGHFAFVDPSTGLVWELRAGAGRIDVLIRVLSFWEMKAMGIMEVQLDAVSNMQTAFHSGGGNWFEALTQATSIGLKQITAAKRIRVWMDGLVVDDQSWQRWISKAAALLPDFTGLLPCTCTRACPDVQFNFAAQVAEQASAALH